MTFNIVTGDVRFQLRQNFANTKFQLGQIVGVGFTNERGNTNEEKRICKGCIQILVVSISCEK